MFNEGFVTNIDVQQAQVYDMKINSMLLEANSKYKLAIAYLKFLTNDKTITDIDDFKVMEVPSSSLEILQVKAVQNRDDLSWMKQNTNTMKTKIEFEKSENYPMIGAHLEYGFNDDELINIDSKHDYYTAAVGLQYKIFSGFERSSNIQKAKIAYAKTKHYLEYMTDGIKLEVEKALLTLKTKQSVLKQKLKAQNLAEEVLEKSEEMYKNNLMKMSDLLMQQASAQQARAEAIMAKYEATISAAKLKLSLGQNLKGEK
jgi:outer membrane protein TolC